MTSETKSDKVAKREIMVTLLFFGALVAAIVASAIIGFHKFFTTEESVSEKVSLVVQHNNPGQLIKQHFGYHYLVRWYVGPSFKTIEKTKMCFKSLKTVFRF